MADPETTPSVESKEGNSEVAPNYDSMSVEEIELEFERTGGVNPEEGSEESVAPEPEPAPEPVAAEAPKEEVVETPAEVVVEPETDDRELQMQEMQLQMERMKLDKHHFEHLAGKNATAVDDLRKELQASSVARPPVEDPIYQEDTPQSVAPAPRTVPVPDVGLAGKVAELQQSQVAQETERVYNSFLEKIKSDLSTQGVKQDQIETEMNSVMEQITPTLKQGFKSYGDLSTYPVKTLSKVTRMVLDSAYTDVRLAKVADLRSQHAERKATQIADNKIAKQAAQTSGSSGRTVGEPPPKSVEDMSAEEADAEMSRLYGDGRGNLRARR